MASCSTRFATKRSPRRPKENAQRLRQESWAWPISSALIDNTIDMQSVSRPREKSATGAQIPHRTTGPAARSNRGAPRSRGPTGAPEGGALGSSAKLRATFYDPMESRVQRFALQSVARSILPESRTAKCLESGRMTVTSSMEIQGARHGQLWRAANLRQRLDLPCVCGQDRGTAARRAAGRDGAAQGPRRRGLSLTLTTPISAATFSPSCWTSRKGPAILPP